MAVKQTSKRPNVLKCGCIVDWAVGPWAPGDKGAGRARPKETACTARRAHYVGSLDPFKIHFLLFITCQMSIISLLICI